MHDRKQKCTIAVLSNVSIIEQMTLCEELQNVMLEAIRVG